MNRKWIGFAATAALVAACGARATASSRAQDQEKHKEKETPLGKIMEKVQKQNIAITKATRNAAAFKKSQKDVEKSAAEIVKLAKESKPLKEGYLKNAKNETAPDKKWDEIMDAFIKTSQGARRRRRQGRHHPEGGQGPLPEREEDLLRLPHGLPGGRGVLTADGVEPAEPRP